MEFIWVMIKVLFVLLCIVKLGGWVFDICWDR